MGNRQAPPFPPYVEAMAYLDDLRAQRDGRLSVVYEDDRVVVTITVDGWGLRVEAPSQGEACWLLANQIRSGRADIIP